MHTRPQTGFKPVLSIITVVYNNAKDIERTLLSVLSQTYTNIEYIVIDGGSTDGTLQIIESYRHRIAVLVSEKDKGIYDAMNKGLRLAGGDYVLFMNSGDELYSPHTVEKVFSTKPNADIYYGETEMYSQEWKSLGRRRHKVPGQLTFQSFKYGMSVSHQAIYIRRQLAGFYNPQYKLSADIDWILNALKEARKVVRVEGYVAKYLVGGMSKKRHRESLKERFAILSKHYGLLPNVFNHLVIACRLGLYYLKHRRTND